MLVDSHTHINFPELKADLEHYLQLMKDSDVAYALCVATKPDNWDIIVDIAEKYPNIFASVGVHPDERLPELNLTKQMLLNYTKHNKIIAIGETGLDYCAGEQSDFTYQHERFTLQIEVANEVGLPLIVHTRESIKDTLAIMRENKAKQAVMHCFTESKEMAKLCLDLGYYISISGIVTFKNAKSVQEMASYVPLDRLLVETDAPFLAPHPFRGKLNHPALVKHTASYLANLKGISLEALAQQTSANFFQLFNKASISLR